MIDAGLVLFKGPDARLIVNGYYTKILKIISHMRPQPLGPEVAVNDLIGKEPASDHRVVGAGLDHAYKEICYIVPINVSALELIYGPGQKGCA